MDRLAIPLVLGLGAFFIVWFVAGNELMRRRGRSLALWSKRALDPLGGRQAVQWLTMHSFRLEADGMKTPYLSGTLTGLVESWDVPIIWLANRLNGRRDMVLLQLALRKQPIWGLELYRRRSVLAGDARQMAREEGWAEEPLDEFLLAAPATMDLPTTLAREMLAVLGPERANLVRLAIRRRGLHLTLALNVPDRSRFTPADFSRLVSQLVQVLSRYTTPGPAAG